MADLLVRRAGRVFGHDVEGESAIVVRGGRVREVVAEGDLARLDGVGDVPELVAAHTHLVFAGDRAREFEARLAGTPYEAGGIMRTVEATRAAPFEDLVEGVVARAEACLSTGTTTIEVKSGYGLTTESERRCLEAVAAARTRTTTDLVPTFLGAHLNPSPDYLDVLVEEMLPACVPLAESCDAFCDKGALTVEESRRVLEAGARLGLVPRIHAEELAHTGRAQLAAELGC